MKKVQKLVFYIKDLISWSLAKMKAVSLKFSKTESILLLPAGDLDGGFGEDIMITSFIHNFSESKPVSILTKNLIRRDDFLGGFNNVSYQSGFGEVSYSDLLMTLKEHSQLFAIGADIMDGTYGYYNTVTRIRLMQLANMIGLKTRFSGFSVSNTVTPFAKEGLQEISKFALIKARDEDSYARLSNFIRNDRLLLTNDIAFICPDIRSTYEGPKYDAYAQWCDTLPNGNRVIAICPNSIQARKITLEKYVDDMIFLLDTFRTHEKFAFVFLYHDLRPLCEGHSDKDISEKLYNHFTGLDDANCYFPQEISNGVQIKGYLNKVDFTITGRMHLGISGIVTGKPMFGICYANKFEGMLKLFSVEPSKCLVDYTDMQNCSSVVDSFLSSYTEIESLITKNLSSVQAVTKKNGLF